MREIQSAKEWIEQLNEGEIELEDYLSLLQEFKPDVRVPLIRYENAPGEYVTLQHPCSHFHVDHHSDNRWAANRSLTPPAFTLLICKLYYSASWSMHWTHRPNGERFNKFEELLAKEKEKSPVLADQYFSKIETNSFHFA